VARVCALLGFITTQNLMAHTRDGMPSPQQAKIGLARDRVEPLRHGRELRGRDRAGVSAQARGDTAADREIAVELSWDPGMRRSASEPAFLSRAHTWATFQMAA